jgi:hypothetical protein
MSVFFVYTLGASRRQLLFIHNPGHCPIARNLGLTLITSHIHMSEEVISAHSLHHLPPPHSDASWVNSPILFTSGPLRGRWIRFVFSFIPLSISIVICHLLLLESVNLHATDASHSVPILRSHATFSPMKSCFYLVILSSVVI